jgi:hypothetical protein
MDKIYWIRRQQEAVTMARAAISSEARLVHYELAGRCSLRAARSAPFMLIRKGAEGEGEATAIRQPVAAASTGANEDFTARHLSFWGARRRAR